MKKKLWKNSRNLRENLCKRMPKLAKRYFAAGNAAMAVGTSWEDMHSFRLDTKRFRYTLEIFSDLYGPAMDSRIESLKKLQTYLGDVNDAIVTGSLLEAVEHTEAIRAQLAAKAEALTEELRDYWRATFAAPGAERRWTQYLVTYAACTRIPRTRRIVQSQTPTRYISN
jgi:CHAD domain-containing protein